MGMETALFSKSFLGDVFMPLMYILWAWKRRFDRRFHALMECLKGRETALFNKILPADVFPPFNNTLTAAKRHNTTKQSSSLPTRPIVGQHSGRRIVHVTALPLPVGHPEIRHHFSLAGIILLEDLPVQQ